MKAIVLWILRIGMLVSVSSTVWATSIDSAAFATAELNGPVRAHASSAPVKLVPSAEQPAPPPPRTASANAEMAAVSSDLLPTSGKTRRPVLLLVCAAIVMGLVRVSERRRDVFDYYAGQ